MAEQLLTREEVSSRLQVPVGTLKFWHIEHKGPRARKVGKNLRYREADLNAWVRLQFADGLAARLDAARQALGGEDPEALRTAVTELLSVLDGEVPR
ncbi:MAG TPA: hypothetical protein PKM13_07370 [Candidatus Bipolaricaulis anaerobius]|nr:hypothetical protein [Candidatus Bipolaricaulis anaerobius]